MLRVFKLSRWYLAKGDNLVYHLSKGILEVHGYIGSSAVESYMNDNQGVFFPKEFFFCS